MLTDTFNDEAEQFEQDYSIHSGEDYKTWFRRTHGPCPVFF